MISKIKILVVDDVFAERDRIVEWIESCLSKDSFEIIEETNWQDAIRRIKTSPYNFDFVFTDMFFEAQFDNNRGGKEIALCALEKAKTNNTSTRIILVSKVDKIGKWVRNLEEELKKLEILSKPPESTQDEFNEKFKQEFVKWLDDNYKLSNTDQKESLLNVLKTENLSGDEFVMLNDREWSLKYLFSFVNFKKPSDIVDLKEMIRYLTSFKHKVKEFADEFQKPLPGFVQKWGHFALLFDEYRAKGLSDDKFSSDFESFNEVILARYYPSHKLLSSFYLDILRNIHDKNKCEEIIDTVIRPELRINDIRIADGIKTWYLLIADWNRIEGCIGANAKRHNSLVHYKCQITGNEIIISANTENTGFSVSDREKMIQSFLNHSIEASCKIKQLSYLVCDVYEGLLEVFSRNEQGNFLLVIQSCYQNKIEWKEIDQDDYLGTGTYYKMKFKK